jgi:hypothetical protein
MSALILSVLLLQFQGGVPSPDSVESLRKAARRAEAEFERLSRQLAPVKFSSMDGTNCDEIVGRFCLRYDGGDVQEPPEEPSRVLLARRLAIEALRHAFSYQAGEFSTSGPLVRYLVEDDRAAEAASAARTFVALSADSIWGPLLLGFALHAMLDDTAAERLFAEGLGRMPAAERERVLNVEWLLSYEDRRRYRKLDHAARAAFEDALWAFADPLYLTPGNERRNQHIARHLWSRMLERAPVVTGMVRWGRDLEELTVRYGIPAGRTRSPGSMGREGGLVEHFDPDQLAYIPEDLLARGPPPGPLPGETWKLENPRSRGGFAPATIRRLRPLEHQVTRIPVGDSVIVRLDAQIAMDSLAAGARMVETGLWTLTEGSRVIASRRSTAILARDTARFALEVLVGPGEHLYSAEAFEPTTRFGARARYALDIAQPVGPVLLSDPLLAEPFRTGTLPRRRDDPALRPLASLVVAAGDTLGLYAEARGLARGAAGVAFRVELALRKADRGSLPSRIVSWLGNRIGLSEPEVPPRLAWEDYTEGPGPVSFAVDLPLDPNQTGLYLLSVRLSSAGGGDRAESTRLLRIVKRPRS